VLTEAGSDMNKAAENGVTPLCVSAARGHKAALQALIEAGADVNKSSDLG